jgi:4-amino-4-deoxy-L-arabinose transferase-like glycosyltransferase
MSDKEELTIDFGSLSNKLKNIKYEYVFLFIFLVLGFYLRSYHIDYPSIGYHNMKENEYIGAAKFMYSEGDFLHRKLFRMGNLDVPYFEEYPQIPLIQWSAVIFWKLLGFTLWPVRLLMILASVFSIYVVYLLINELSKNRYLSLLSAFLMSVLPLGIFFGRNIQPESPALFFVLLGVLYYVRWLNSNFEKKQILLSALFLGIAGLFKYTFLIVFIPMFFIFPFSRFKDKNFFGTIKKSIIPTLLGLAPLILWTVFSPLLNKTSSLFSGTASRIDLFRIFSFSYWQQFWPSFNNYIGDNYTWWYFWFAVFGVMMVSLTLKEKKSTYLSIFGILIALVARFSVQGTLLFVISFFVIFAIILANAIFSLKHKKSFQTFILFYTLSIIPYCMLLSDYIKAHNYYQMPFLPLIAILSAYFIYTIGSFLKQIVKVKFINFLPLVLILLTIPQIEAHKNAMFDTQFFGLDVAGEYLKENMAQGQRFFLFGESQSVAACVYAERLCIMNTGLDFSKFKEYETERGIEWIYVDAGTGGLQFLMKDKEVYDYVQKNYGLNAVGILKTNQGYMPVTFILKKGGSVNFENLSSDPILQKQPIKQMDYGRTVGKLEYYLIG